MFDFPRNHFGPSGTGPFNSNQYFPEKEAGALVGIFTEGSVEFPSEIFGGVLAEVSKEVSLGAAPAEAGLSSLSLNWPTRSFSVCACADISSLDAALSSAVAELVCTTLEI